MGYSNRLWLLALCLLTGAAFAQYYPPEPDPGDFDTFRIEQIYSNADGTVQFVVMYEAFNSNGKNLWANQVLTSLDGTTPKVLPFMSNLPSSATAGRRVLIATQGFAALGIVTPNYIIPDGFLPIAKGSLDFAGVDQVSYASLPIDGTHAIDRNGTAIHNVAINFAGVSASVAGAPVALVPEKGLWWNPAEDGTGYNFDIKHGVLVISMFTYEASGHSEWYVAAGPLTDNGTKFSGTLDKYRGGQCLVCSYTGRPTLAGNDGTVSITFTSPTSAIITLPGNRVSTIQPQVF